MKNIKKSNLRIIGLFLAAIILISSAIPAVAENKGATLSDDEAKTAMFVNEKRIENGLKPLSIAVSLQPPAHIRAEEASIQWSHTRPNGTGFSTAIKESSYSLEGGYVLGENLAHGQKTPSSVTEAWMNSPAHRANILNEMFTHTGIGDFGSDHYRAQLFAGTPSGECKYSNIRVFNNTLKSSYKKGTAINDMGIILALECDRHGTCIIPVGNGMCSGYSAAASGTQTVTVDTGRGTTKLQIKTVGTPSWTLPTMPTTTEPVPTTTKPVTTEPTTTKPVTTEPTTTEPVTTEPTTTEPVTAEPTTTEPVTAEPTTTEPVTTEPTTTEPVTTEPTTTEPVTTEPTTTEPVTAEPTTTEPVTAEPTPTVWTPTDPTSTEPTQTEPTPTVWDPTTEPHEQDTKPFISSSADISVNYSDYLCIINHAISPTELKNSLVFNSDAEIQTTSAEHIGTGSLIKMLKTNEVFTCVVLGDDNGDGRINSSDARLVLRHSAKLSSLSGEYLIAADINSDGRQNSSDARTILRIAAKLQ